jgi:hypothetical protein
MRATRARVLTRQGVVTVVVVGLAMVVVVVTAGKTAASNAPKAEIATAKKALLVQSDMPKGWKSSASSNNNPATPGAAQLAHCIGIPVSEINDMPPTAYSRDFNSADDLQSAYDNVSIFPSAKAARADMAADASAKTPGCLTTNFNGPSKKLLASSFGSGAVVGTIDVTRTPASYYAPHATNLTIYFPVTTQDETLNVESTEVTFVRGREEQTVTLVSVQTPFPTALARRLTTVADRRL